MVTTTATADTRVNTPTHVVDQQNNVSPTSASASASASATPTTPSTSLITKLTNHEIQRYSRQLLMPEIGMRGQLAIKNTSVLVVGAGGLGSPCSLYLAAAGIGRLGLVDYDSVDLSNLHRQLIHTTARIGQRKVTSARDALVALNPCVQVECHDVLLSPGNALDIARGYDIVVDASDNPATRYLVNDVAVALGKPLVSGSALRMEGQLTVYHWRSNGDDGEYGPCYRCMFPEPPLAATVTNCGDGGVLGAVPGLVGTAQAMEVVKLAVQLKSKHFPTACSSSKSPSDATTDNAVLSGRLLLIDGWTSQFRTVKLRMRRRDCVACGDRPVMDEQAIRAMDYEKFCGRAACDGAVQKKVLTGDRRLSCESYSELVSSHTDHMLLDVRPRLQYDICHLKHAVNIPLTELHDHLLANHDLLEECRTRPVVVVCRRGNASQDAVVLLEERFGVRGRDVVGGLTAWAREVDPDFPTY